MEKIIIAGTRSFNNYEFLKLSLLYLLFPYKKDKLELLSGGANGADKLAEKFAQENKINIKVFRADWDKHGRAAGPIRNQKMVEEATALIAFWDNKSKGTYNVIKQAKDKGIKTIILDYKKHE